MSVNRFRPVPRHLKSKRFSVKQREHARFYGSFRTMTGKTRRFSFQVKMSSKLSNRDKYKLIRDVVLTIKDRKLPEHKMGQRFSSFKELLRRTPWFRVRKILNYEAGIKYVR